MGLLRWIFGPRPTPPPPPRPDSREGIVDLGEINRVRGSGLVRRGPLAEDVRLGLAALAHSRDQAARRSIGHRGSDGSSFAQRAAREGFLDPDFAMGECVAVGQPDSAAVASSWRSSPAHAAIINASNADCAGLAVAYDDRGRPYWTLVTGRRSWS